MPIKQAHNDIENKYLLLQLLKCPVCDQTIRDTCPESCEPNVFQCSNGHFFVQRLQDEHSLANIGNTKVCPSCRSSLAQPIRNLFAVMGLTLYYEDTQLEPLKSNYLSKIPTHLLEKSVVTS